MTWKGVGSFPPLKINVVKTKINLYRVDVLPLNMYKQNSVVGYAGMCPLKVEVLGLTQACF